MKIKKFEVKACCGKKSIIFQIDQPITKDLLVKLTQSGFTESPNFTKAGILYITNDNFVITGPIGSDKLQIKCRTVDCEDKLKSLEETLTKV